MPVKCLIALHFVSAFISRGRLYACLWGCLAEGVAAKCGANHDRPATTRIHEVLSAAGGRTPSDSRGVYGFESVEELQLLPLR